MKLVALILPALMVVSASGAALPLTVRATGAWIEARQPSGLFGGVLGFGGGRTSSGTNTAKVPPAAAQPATPNLAPGDSIVNLPDGSQAIAKADGSATDLQGQPLSDANAAAVSPAAAEANLLAESPPNW